jgi:hypothetical protein
MACGICSIQPIKAIAVKEDEPRSTFCLGEVPWVDPSYGVVVCLRPSESSITFQNQTRIVLHGSKCLDQLVIDVPYYSIVWSELKIQTGRTRKRFDVAGRFTCPVLSEQMENLTLAPGPPNKRLQGCSS